jgi:hypothetical protein
MFTLQCQKCSHSNWIEQPLQPAGQPLQDWFCKKCDNKLFSVSFKDPIHPDTVPIQCSKCKKDLYCKFNTEDKSSTQISWSCNACKTTAAKLKIERKIVSKTSSPLRVSKPRDTKKLPANKIVNDPIQIFLSKYWRLIGLVAIVAFIWVSISDNTSTNYPRKTAPAVSATKTQNVYRGTKVAKSEFYKYSKSQRRRIQLFLKNNFGYKSTIDGLWGPQTANSFLRAANRYARGKSLSSIKNVGIVFSAAIKESPSSTSQTISRSQGSKPKWDTRPNNGNANLNLTELERRMLNVAIGSCVGRGPDCAPKAMQNFYCMKQYGRPCQQELAPTLQLPKTCIIQKGPWDISPDELVCY